MKFKERLLQGTLIKRYKRFFVDIKYKNTIITAHCPNSGSMMGLLDDGNKVWFSLSNNPKRKLKYTLEIIEVGNERVGINTLLANKIVLEALNCKKINSLIKFDNIKTEAKFSEGTRFDFLLSNNKEKCFLEVKNVTLLRKKKIAEFPDAVTSRGKKHLYELCNAKKKGYQSYILYLIQRENCDSFKIAEDIDEEYKIAFSKALKYGVKILCYVCKLNSEEIKLNKQINYEE
uniref:Sugar fermentation stimulation protein homolog n=1 Tax=uncultured Alphaproteobacteria bacterium TaxID=91750 RepID=A0A1B0Z1M3_9PROT|nr:sugar fermentation stimulation protein [uncultured Alphaproteobacteria bacterium]